MVLKRFARHCIAAKRRFAGFPVFSSSVLHTAEEAASVKIEPNADPVGVVPAALVKVPDVFVQVTAPVEVVLVGSPLRTYATEVPHCVVFVNPSPTLVGEPQLVIELQPAEVGLTAVVVPVSTQPPPLPRLMEYTPFPAVPLVVP
jgi:hypothetical protein